MSDAALSAIGAGLGFDANGKEFRTWTAIEFAKWYNDKDSNTYDGRFAAPRSPAAVAAPSGLACIRTIKPVSKDRRLVTIELRSDRNDTFLPWPLHIGLSLGTGEKDGLAFTIRHGRLQFKLGEGNAHTDLPGERRAFPGDLEVVPVGLKINLTPDGDAFKPEWIFKAAGRSEVVMTARNLIDIYDLRPGDVVEVRFLVVIKDLVIATTNPKDSDGSPSRGQTRAFVWKKDPAESAPPRDAKAALLEHIAAIRLMQTEDGEAALAKDELQFTSVADMTTSKPDDS